MIMSQHNRACQQRCYFPNLSQKIEDWKTIFMPSKFSMEKHLWFKRLLHFLGNLPNFKMGKDLPFLYFSPKPLQLHPETPNKWQLLSWRSASILCCEESHRNRSMFVDLFFFQYVRLFFGHRTYDIWVYSMYITLSAWFKYSFYEDKSKSTVYILIVLYCYRSFGLREC